MKKHIAILSIIACITLSVVPCFAINIGTYQTETEYGLLDGFKINWKRKDKSQPFIEPREESSKFQKEKERRYYNEDEYYQTKYLYEGKSIL